MKIKKYKWVYFAIGILPLFAISTLQEQNNKIENNLINSEKQKKTPNDYSNSQMENEKIKEIQNKFINEYIYFENMNLFQENQKFELKPKSSVIKYHNNNYNFIYEKNDESTYQFFNNPLFVDINNISNLKLINNRNYPETFFDLKFFQDNNDSINFWESKILEKFGLKYDITNPINKNAKTWFSDKAQFTVPKSQHWKPNISSSDNQNFEKIEFYDKYIIHDESKLKGPNNGSIISNYNNKSDQWFTKENVCDYRIVASYNLRENCRTIYSNGSKIDGWGHNNSDKKQGYIFFQNNYSAPYINFKNKTIRIFDKFYVEDKADIKYDNENFLNKINNKELDHTYYFDLKNLLKIKKISYINNNVVLRIGFNYEELKKLNEYEIKNFAITFNALNINLILKLNERQYNFLLNFYQLINDYDINIKIDDFLIENKINIVEIKPVSKINKKIKLFSNKNYKIKTTIEKKDILTDNGFLEEIIISPIKEIIFDENRKNFLLSELFDKKNLKKAFILKNNYSHIVDIEDINSFLNLETKINDINGTGEITYYDFIKKEKITKKLYNFVKLNSIKNDYDFTKLNITNNEFLTKKVWQKYLKEEGNVNQYILEHIDLKPLNINDLENDIKMKIVAKDLPKNILDQWNYKYGNDILVFKNKNNFLPKKIKNRINKAANLYTVNDVWNELLELNDFTYKMGINKDDYKIILNSHDNQLDVKISLKYNEHLGYAIFSFQNNKSINNNNDLLENLKNNETDLKINSENIQKKQKYNFFNDKKNNMFIIIFSSFGGLIILIIIATFVYKKRKKLF